MRTMSVISVRLGQTGSSSRPPGHCGKKETRSWMLMSERTHDVILNYFSTGLLLILVLKNFNIL
jgi:hypothetical protein